jgi:hypothetical protein
MEWIVAAILLLVAAVVLIFVARSVARNSRYARLMAKYGDEKLVHAIVTQTIWQGMTVDQLKDSWGEPASVEQKVMKTKVREVFKYKPVGKNRFRDKVTLEDGVITGWDQK